MLTFLQKIILIYDTLDDRGESINFNRLLLTKKTDYNTLSNYIKKNNLGELDFNKNKNEIFLKKPSGEVLMIDINEICLKNLSKDLRYKKIFNKYI